MTNAPCPSLGDPIALEDLLALPPDGRRYDRDAQGRLVLMAPADAPGHGYPIIRLNRHLVRSLDLPWEVAQERGIAFDPIYDLRGGVVPESRLGRRSIALDFAVFSARPRHVPHRESGGVQVFLPDGLALAIEVLSPHTYRSDLGLGQADEVDCWRTYLANEVPGLLRG